MGKYSIFAVLFLVTSVSVFANSKSPLYKDPQQSPAFRTQDLLQRMTLSEKLDILSGDTTGFATKSNTRLGIPAINMADGPLGIRIGKSTAFPAGILLGASFNPEITKLVSQTIALEAKAHGRNMLLAPCINISRTPFGGRNFESFGEDPYLTSRMAEAYVAGVQGEGVMASTKHFALNEQEFKRTTINVIADERSMQEIHFPAFQAAVNAGTYTVMSSYNKLNGYWTSENLPLLSGALKQQWNFLGWVVSDWVSTHDTSLAANAGLDVEMPNADIFTQAKLLAAINSGEVSMTTIDDKVSRILLTIFQSGIFDVDPKTYPDPSTIGSAAHRKIALQAAQEGIVLLKNDSNLLPLKNIKSIAVIGANAFHARLGGGGSSSVNAISVITPLEGLRSRFSKDVVIRFEEGAPMRGDFSAIPASYWSTDVAGKNPGLTGEYYSNKDLFGKPTLTRIDPSVNFDWGQGSPSEILPVDAFSVRWTGYLKVPETGDYNLMARSDDGVRVSIEGRQVINSWQDQSAGVQNQSYHFESGRSYRVVMEYFENQGDAVAGLGLGREMDQKLPAAVALAAKSDVAIIFAGLSNAYEGEGFDRQQFGLPEGQDELINKVVAANPNTIVVINGGNPVAMPWIAQVPAVLYSWYAGQEGGAAVADVISGNINPSGKLPVSFPKRWEDHPAFGHYPEDKGIPDQVTYAEGIYLGYRHYDTRHVQPLFPFGFGLSYTNFEYKNLQVIVQEDSVSNPKVQIKFDIKNTGKVVGAEVAQLYVQPVKSVIDRPTQELKSFKKVKLNAGETKHVTMTLESGAFSYYDVNRRGWKVDPGQFGITVGSSSRDPRLQGNVQLR